VRTQNRDDFISKLAEKEISCGIHYPVPVHLQDAYDAPRVANGNCPVAERCAQEYVSFPMYPELRAEQIDYVMQQVETLL
jgi:dTDP-4-amino-4,6-dideoxygalactose transaminase